MSSLSLTRDQQDEVRMALWAELSPDGEIGADSEPEFSAKAFEILVAQGFAADYHYGERAIDQLEDRILSIDEVFTAQESVRAQAQKAPKATAPDHRAAALAEIFALEAQTDPAILAFRDRVLPDGLVPPENIPDWITQTAEEDGTPTNWVTVPMGDDNKPLVDPSQRPTPVPGVPFDWKSSLRLLSYAGPSDQDVHQVPVRIDGTLGELWHLATKVSDQYGWPQAHAVNLVIAGVTPPPSPGRVEMIEPWPWRRARRSISIEVNPATSPADVAAIYRQARNQLMGDESRARQMTEKHAKLGLFAFRFRQGSTWHELQIIWNESHPEESYDNLNQFIRDARNAFERITGEPLNWLGKST